MQTKIDYKLKDYRDIPISKVLAESQVREVLILLDHLKETMPNNTTELKDIENIIRRLR